VPHEQAAKIAKHRAHQCRPLNTFAPLWPMDPERRIKVLG